MSSEETLMLLASSMKTKENELVKEELMGYAPTTWWINADDYVHLKPKGPMNWISVKDRLPEYQDECIVFDGHEVTTAIWVCGVWSADQLGTVTHWMPLPNPPEVFDCENCLKEKCVRVESESWSARQRRVCQAGCGELSTLPNPPEVS